MVITDLREFARSKGIELKDQAEIAEEASRIVAARQNFDTNQIKQNFDALIGETEKETYAVYLKYEQQYGGAVFQAFVDHLEETGELKKLSETGAVLGKYFALFDKFFLSLAQGRKARAGKSFESIHNSLFKVLNYPFQEQVVINGKPDFLMPSAEHYTKNAMDCIIFTAKRTLRERWRQIVTEGTRGLGFYLATIDEKVSDNQVEEMRAHRIYLVVPEAIRKKHYAKHVNVLSFQKFFTDHLDPAVRRWERNGVVQ